MPVRVLNVSVRVWFDDDRVVDRATCAAVLGIRDSETRFQVEPGEVPYQAAFLRIGQYAWFDETPDESTVAATFESLAQLAVEWLRGRASVGFPARESGGPYVDLYVDLGIDDDRASLHFAPDLTLECGRHRLDIIVGTHTFKVDMP
jgi:hypothetical protein